jgi:hypothetical protein
VPERCVARSDAARSRYAVRLDAVPERCVARSDAARSRYAVRQPSPSRCRLRRSARSVRDSFSEKSDT